MAATAAVRIALLAAAVALSSTGPAHADEGLGANTQFAGSVASTSEALIGGSTSDISAQMVVAVCFYAGQTTLSGQMQYQFGGVEVATTTGPSMPEYTDLKCTLISPAQGLPGEMPTQTASLEIALGAPVAATVSTVTGWPVRPVTICVDGNVTFGPNPMISKEIIHACKTSTL